MVCVPFLSTATTEDRQSAADIQVAVSERKVGPTIFVCLFWLKRKKQAGGDVNEEDDDATDADEVNNIVNQVTIEKLEQN